MQEPAGFRTLNALQVWLDVTERMDRSCLGDIRRTFPMTDMTGERAIFNIRENPLIIRMEFEGRRIYINELLAHADDDKGAWKREWP